MTVYYSEDYPVDRHIRGGEWAWEDAEPGRRIPATRYKPNSLQFEPSFREYIEWTSIGKGADVALGNIAGQSLGSYVQALIQWT